MSFLFRYSFLGLHQPSHKTYIRTGEEDILIHHRSSKESETGVATNWTKVTSQVGRFTYQEISIVVKSRAETENGTVALDDFSWTVSYRGRDQKCNSCVIKPCRIVLLLRQTPKNVPKESGTARTLSVSRSTSSAISPTTVATPRTRWTAQGTNNATLRTERTLADGDTTKDWNSDGRCEYRWIVYQWYSTLLAFAF